MNDVRAPFLTEDHGRSQIPQQAPKRSVGTDLTYQHMPMEEKRMGKENTEQIPFLLLSLIVYKSTRKGFNRARLECKRRK